MSSQRIKKRFWTEPEDEVIRRMFADHFSYKAIATALDRPLGSVSSRISALGLAVADEQTNTRGTTLRPQPGVTVHYGNYRYNK
jgi:hypothetical protein